MESNEFYANVREECKQWEQSEEGKAFLKDQLDNEIKEVKTNNIELGQDISLPTVPKILRQREFGDFYNSLIHINIELIDDYFLLFSIPSIEFPRAIYTFKTKNINFVYKTEISTILFGLFFDSPVTHIDKIEVLKELSKMIGINLVLSERNLFRPFDTDLIMGEDKDGNIWMNEWENYFLFNNYFQTEEYYNSDKHNYHSLPTNSLNPLIKSKKRIHITQWE